MSSLVVGGVAIKVAVSSPRWTRSDAVDRARAFDNTFRASQTGGAVRVWDFETPPVLAATEGETYKAALSTVASQLCLGDIIAIPTMCSAELTDGVPTSVAGEPYVVLSFTLHEQQPAKVLLRYAPGDTISGESFSRSTTATYVTTAGLFASAAINAKRDSHYASIGGTRSLLLEEARTNLVVQSDALTAANGWTVDVGVTPTAAFSTCGVLNLTKFAGAAAGSVYRAVTLTGDGVKALSWVVQWDGVAGTSIHEFTDVGTATRCRVTLTWTAGGTATAVASIGTLLQLVALGSNTYRILAVSTSCAAANPHRIYASATGTATSIRVAGVQVEDAVFPSSVIPTTTAMVTRGADSYSLPFTTPPQEMTAFVKFVEGGTIYGNSLTIFQISDTASNTPRFFLRQTPAFYKTWHLTGSTVSATQSVAPVLGDTVEVMSRLFGDGSVDGTQTINSGASDITAQSTANALTAAWSDDVLWLNSGGTSAATTGFTALQSFKIVAGARSLAEMRTL